VAQYQEFLEQENQQIAANIEEMEDQLDCQEGQWAMEEEEMLRELRGMGYISQGFEEEEDTVEAQKQQFIDFYHVNSEEDEEEDTLHI
jgi:hypothetical protein